MNRTKKASVKEALRVSIVIPTYNEAANIPALLKALSRACASLKPHLFTVLFVDDNSPDGTAEKIRQLSKQFSSSRFRITMLEQPGKTSLGAAYKAGFSKVLAGKSDYIVQMDADLSHNPAYLKQFIKQAELGADVIAGTRYKKPGGTPDWSLHRRLLSRAGNVYSRLLLRGPVSDYTGGFGMFKSTLLQRVDFSRIRSHGYSFQIELKHQLAQLTDVVVEVPIVFRDRTQGRSKIPKNTISESLWIVTRGGIGPLIQRVLKAGLKEIWPLLILGALVALKLVHITNSGWAPVFFYNTDSLTLPQLYQSLLAKEPWQWVFSAQFNLFPAMIFYWFSAAVTGSVQSALLVNAALHVYLLYVLLRFVTRLTLPAVGLFARQAGALSASSLLVIYMLLERNPFNVRQQSGSLTTLFLFNTYFADVIIAGLTVLVLTLYGGRLHERRARKRRLALIVAASCLITSLAVISNPLFLVQFSLPLGAAAGIFYLTKRLRLRQAFVLLAPVLTGSLVGYVLRMPLGGWMSQSTTSHIKTKNIEQTVRLVWDAVTDIAARPEGVGLLLLGVLAFGAAVVLGIRLLRSSGHPLDGPFVYLFSAIGPILVLLVTVVTGAKTTRFLLPLLIFPLLAVAVSAAKAVQKKKLYGPGALLVALTIACTASLIFLAPRIKNLAERPDPTVACATEALGSHHAVATYWIAKQFDVYGSNQGGRVLQVRPNGTIYPWIANRAAYRGKEFSYAITTDREGLRLPIKRDYRFRSDRKPTGHVVAQCGRVNVLYFPAGTPEHTALNKAIHQSLDRADKLVGENNMPAYFGF